MAVAVAFLSLFAAVAILLPAVDCSKVFTAYFPNWAHRREPEFSFRPENLSDIVGRLDHLIYAYAHIDPSNYSVVLTDAIDPEFIRELVSYKTDNDNLKVLLSIGGDKFPSENFSEMAATYERRAAFIESLKQFLHEYNLDGVEINWQFPCSEAKTIYLEEWHKFERSCESVEIREIYDSGGLCPDDSDNLLFLVQQLRASLANEMLITLLGPPTKRIWRKMDLKMLSRYIDYWHVATYDFTNPALNGSTFTGPNSPLHRPPKLSTILSFNINDTIGGYLSAGVPSSKLLPGVPLFGHAWYLPNTSGSKWQNFGIKASIQGSCCGPFKKTYGAGYGKISQQCGTFMYSEIMLTQPPPRVYYDKATQTAIGFMKYTSNDGLISKGTWFTFNNKNSIEALTNFIAYHQLGGAFVYEASQDSFDRTTKKFTFDLMEAVYEGLQGQASGFICNPVVGCNVCYECCRSFLTNQFDCDACAAVRCPSPPTQQYQIL